MKPEDQRIAIAEACGWSIHQIKFGGVPDVAILPPGVKLTDELAVWHYAGLDLPDYLGDLNAMNAAEATLRTCAEKQAFVEHLHSLVPESSLFTAGDNRSDLYFEVFGLTHASVEQRANAFLHAKRLWVDTP